MPALKLVGPEPLPPAPYDVTVGAKGWRFEIDYERVEQSDTWALADPEMRPWLLMLWLTAWKQRPCGSLPNDDALIAARVGMKLNVFRANREVLMRGWWLADDGKLYHDTIVERATLMLGSLRKESARKQAYRESKKNQEVNENVPPDVPGTSAGQTRTSTGRDATGTGTGTGVSTESPKGDLSTTVVDRPPDIPDCPHSEIVAAYHRLLPMCPQVVEWNAGRQKSLRARWRENPKRQTLRWWERYFAHVAKSRFLTGGADAKPGQPPFVADIDFLLRPSRLVAIIEGKYHEAAT